LLIPFMNLYIKGNQGFAYTFYESIYKGKSRVCLYPL
jgi:hypothetical protein